MDFYFGAAEVSEHLVDAVLGGIIFQRFVDVRVGGGVAAEDFSEQRHGKFQVTTIPKTQKRVHGEAHTSDTHHGLRALSRTDLNPMGFTCTALAANTDDAASNRS